MQSITFALPTLATDAMDRSEQDRLIVQQVTAAIVCSYLEHMNAAIAHGTPGAEFRLLGSLRRQSWYRLSTTSKVR